MPVSGGRPYILAGSSVFRESNKKSNDNEESNTKQYCLELSGATCLPKFDSFLELTTKVHDHGEPSFVTEAAKADA